MQSPASNTERHLGSNTSRSRCGRCAAYCQSPVHADGGICAWTNGDSKRSGWVTAQQLVCIFRPSKFKPKEFRV